MTWAYTNTHQTCQKNNNIFNITISNHINHINKTNLIFINYIPFFHKPSNHISIKNEALNPPSCVLSYPTYVTVLVEASCGHHCTWRSIDRGHLRKLDVQNLYAKGHGTNGIFTVVICLGGRLVVAIFASYISSLARGHFSTPYHVKIILTFLFPYFAPIYFTTIKKHFPQKSY